MRQAIIILALCGLSTTGLALSRASAVSPVFGSARHQGAMSPMRAPMAHTSPVSSTRSPALGRMESVHVVRHVPVTHPAAIRARPAERHASPTITFHVRHVRT